MENKEKLKITQTIVTEGRYDKIKLSSITDATVIVTNGFGIFKDKELCRLIRFYAEKTGLIVLTDSDSAGRQIRAHIKRIVPKELHDKIINIHIPQIEGKEKRKAAPSKEGTLGVEGISADYLRDLLIQAGASYKSAPDRRRITKNDLFMLGLSGTPDAAKNRELLVNKLSLPHGLSTNALLDLLNTLYSAEELENICSQL
ncbi:MAG: toprim domain-containing protein [Oscillospiraceae bacterium]